MITLTVYRVCNKLFIDLHSSAWHMALGQEQYLGRAHQVI